MRVEAKFTVPGTLGLVLISLLISGSVVQEPRQPRSAQTTIRVQSSLVLVDIISQDPRNGLPVRDFQKEDFRVFDNGNEVPITSFDGGAHYSTRPFILWLAVICNEGGKIGGSREFVGKESLFRPALDHLDRHDTVGVAHWCDNGEARLDLLPTEDRDSPIRVLAETIKPISFHVGGNSNFVGEDTYRKMLRLIIQDAHRRNPQPLPVIVFLDGDHTAQPRFELDQVVDDILETAGIVFGIKDEMSPRVYGLANGEQAEISYDVAEQTGGQYFVAPAKSYATALDMILMQLHFRYELGFIPEKMDGKRHELKVELRKETQWKYKGVRLWFRPEYIPVSEAPAWARCLRLLAQLYGCFDERNCLHSGLLCVSGRDGLVLINSLAGKINFW
jgi:hypothetical protein